MSTLAEALAKATKQTKVPNDIYYFNVVEAKADKSRSGDPQFILECEIVDHPGLKQGDETINLNGSKCNYYITLTEKAAFFVGKFHKSAGLTLDISIEELALNPNPEIYRGKKFRARAFSKENIQKNEVTGAPVLHPDTGEPLVGYNLQIAELF